MRSDSLIYNTDCNNGMKRVINTAKKPAFIHRRYTNAGRRFDIDKEQYLIKKQGHSTGRIIESLNTFPSAAIESISL